MKKRLLFIVAALSAIIVEAQQLRDGHFFKSFTDGQPFVQSAPALFSQWFTLPDDTEWREMSEHTDKLGMTRIEYRQYVSGVEVEHSQVLLHVKDGRVLTANGTVMEQQRTPVRLQRHSMMHRDGTPTDLLGRKLLLIDTDDGYHYATMCTSADGLYKVYHDVDTGEELKRVPLVHSADVPVGTATTTTGKSIYSGYLPLDVTKGANGQYYLYDQQRNILVVWFLTGMWHGAAWNFILWGLYYAFLLMFEKKVLLNWFKRIPKLAADIVGHIYTVVITVFGFAIFYFDKGLFRSLGYLFGIGTAAGTDFFTESILLDNIVLLAAAVFFSIPVIPRLWDRVKDKVPYTAERILKTAVVLVLIGASTVRLVGNSYSPFLYFRF